MPISPDNFDQMVKTFFQSVYTFVWRIVQDEEMASDITQETFIKCWKARGAFNENRASLKTWIFTIAKRTCTDHLRKKQSREKYEIVQDDLPDIEDATPLPDLALEQKEYAKYTEIAFAKLKPQYQEVLILYFQEDMTLATIAEVLDKSINTVKSIHRRALTQLRDELDLLVHPN